MAPKDQMLSLDMGLDDCYYRFRRDHEASSTVVYVYLQDLDILAEDRRTYGPDVIKDLRKVVEIWDQEWTTLTVSKADGEVFWVPDQWKPHSLPPSTVLADVPRLNVLDLKVQHKFKNRVSLIELDGRRHILKICPFAYQLKYFVQEIEAYHTLLERGCSLLPRVAAYVFERSREEIIGFVCEELQGRVAGPSDYSICKQSLTTLHSYGVLHGDINKYNIVISADGPRFLDFETSILNNRGQVSEEEFSHRQQEELDSLETALSDEEGWGKPREE